MPGTAKSLLNLLKGLKQAKPVIREAGGEVKPRRAATRPKGEGKAATEEEAVEVIRREGKGDFIAKDFDETLDTTASTGKASPDTKLATDSADLDRIPLRNEPLPRTETAAEELERLSAKTMSIVEEADDILKLDLGDFKGERPEMPNFKTITGPDEMKAVIANMAKRIESKVNAARGGVRSDAELRAAAKEQFLSFSEDTGVPPDVLRRVLERNFGEGLSSDSIVLASRIVLEKSANRLLKMGEFVRANPGKVTPDFERDMHRQMAFHSEYYSQWMGGRAEIGRMQRAMGIATEGDNIDLEHMDKVIRFYQRGNIKKIADQLEHINTVQGINKYSLNRRRTKKEAVFREWYVGSILSGPVTWGVNTFGNGVFAGMNVAEVAAAARISQGKELIRRTVWGKNTPIEDRVLLGEASAMMAGMVSAFRDGATLAWKAFKAGGDPQNIQKFDTGIPKAISSEFLEWTGPAGAFADFWGFVARFPMERALVPVDVAFKTIAQRADLARSAYRRAARASEANPKLGDRELQNMIATDVATPLRTDFDMAEAYKVYATFQNPLGDTGQKWQRALAATPYGSFLAPFVRTPTNLFKDAFIERTPAGRYMSQIKDQYLRGGAERDLARARMAMGAGTMLLIANMAIEGKITGGGPNNPKAKAIHRAAGWAPYSYVKTDSQNRPVSNHSYARMEPLAFIIGATADAVEKMTAADAAGLAIDDEAQTWGKALLASVIKNTASKTFVQSLADVAGVITDTDRNLDRWLLRAGSGLMPVSSFRRQMARADDPFIREAVTKMEKFNQAFFPNFSESAPKNLDIFGDDQPHPRGGWLGLFQPIGFGPEVTKDWWKLELRNVMLATDDTPISLPPTTIKEVKLDAWQTFHYKNFSRNLLTPDNPVTQNVTGFDGKLKIKFEGTFEQAVKQVMASTIYQQSLPATRAAMLRDVQHKYDSMAAKKMLETDVELAKKVNLRQMKQRAALGLPLFD